MGCPKVHHEIVPPALFYLTELTGCIKHTARLFWFVGISSSFLILTHCWTCLTLCPALLQTCLTANIDQRVMCLFCTSWSQVVVEFLAVQLMIEFRNDVLALFHLIFRNPPQQHLSQKSNEKNWQTYFI